MSYNDPNSIQSFQILQNRNKPYEISIKCSEITSKTNDKFKQQKPHKKFDNRKLWSTKLHLDQDGEEGLADARV